MRAAGELAKAKHDGPRGDITYVDNQKDFSDHTEVLERATQERLNNNALYKVLEEATADGAAGDLR